MRAELADDDDKRCEKGDPWSIWLVLNNADTFDFMTPLYPARITGRVTLTGCAYERDATPGRRDSNWKLRRRTFSTRGHDRWCDVVRSVVTARLSCHREDVFIVIGVASSFRVAAVPSPSDVNRCLWKSRNSFTHSLHWREDNRFNED